MTTEYRDKSGKLVKTDPGTQYHPEGTGPRNADGTPIVDHTTARETPAAPAAADDARPAKQKEDKL